MKKLQKLVKYIIKIITMRGLHYQNYLKEIL